MIPNLVKFIYVYIQFIIIYTIYLGNNNTITAQLYNDAGVCYIVDRKDSMTTNTYECEITTTSSLDTTPTKSTSITTSTLLSSKLNEVMKKSTTSSKLVSNVLKKMNSDSSDFYTSLTCEVGVPVGTVGYIYEQYYNAIECVGKQIIILSLYL